MDRGAVGDQSILVEFDAPRRRGAVLVEVEEKTIALTQQIELTVLNDGGANFELVLRHEFNFSPTGAWFQHERWDIAREGVTHVRLTIRPDKQSPSDGRARMTTLALLA